MSASRRNDVAWMFCALLVSLLPGLALLALAKGAISEQAAVATWTRTTGQLEAIEIVPQPKGIRLQFTAAARYTFAAGTQTWTGTALFGNVSAGSPEVIKARLQPWLTGSPARITEHGAGLDYRFTYTPARQAVPVYFDPADPSRSRCGQPGAAAPAYRRIVQVAGWSLIAIASLTGVIFISASASAWSEWSSRRHLARGLPRPSPTDEAALLQRVDAVIAALRAHPDRGIKTTAAWLENLRARPTDLLLHHERLGLRRGFEERDPCWDEDPMSKPLAAALEELEQFHSRWRQAQSSASDRAAA